MTKTISIISSNNFDPWIISARGQSFINNFYSQKKNFKIDTIYQEPVLQKNYNLLYLKTKKENFRLIFCSIYQLPTNKNDILRFKQNFKKNELHFVLENLSGRGIKYINSIISKIKLYNLKRNITVEKNKYFGEIFKKYKKKIV